MKKNLSLLIIVIIFISSCVEDECAFRFCPTPDFDSINALYFSFDTTNAYSSDEIINAYIIKYVKDGNFTQALDTFYFTEQFAEEDFLMILSDPKPFSSGGTVNINAYENFDYIIRPNDTNSGYKFTNIEVKGEYQDCNCNYINTEKTFKLNDIEVDKTGSTSPILLD